jgi:predicted ATPase with chaperone activity
MTKPEGVCILEAAMKQLGLAARARIKVLRGALTIADLEGQDQNKPRTSTRY